MAAIPETQNTIENLIYKAWADDAAPPRPHMGASMLGHPCDRYLWLKFRWVMKERHSGRMLILFDRGHREEERVVSHLRRIGAHVEKTGANQARVSFGAHVSGSIDGIVSALPIAPKAKAVLEIKTHSDKSFTELKRAGVQKSKPMHWVQMCVYGYGESLDRALYVAVNKNTDEIYTEWLHLDKEVAEKAIARGKRIALSDRMPEPVMGGCESWYQCKVCDMHKFCWLTNCTDQVTCRNCAHSTAKDDNTWHCERHNADDIPVEFQRTGCDSHVLHPDLVPWKIHTDLSTEWEAVWMIDGIPVRNGEPDATVFGSREILANPAACANPDDFVKSAREKLGGRIA